MLAFEYGLNIKSNQVVGNWISDSEAFMVIYIRSGY